MQIQLLGGIGIGLVWGWCLGFWTSWEDKNRHWMNALASGLASLMLAALIQTFAGWRALLYFTVAIALSLFNHFAWRVYLYRRLAA